jgi:hypothetical protein
VSEYHIGPFSTSHGFFDLAASGPPSKMDLGDVFYAPNVLTDSKVGVGTGMGPAGSQHASTARVDDGIRNIWQEGACCAFLFIKS